ncbi:hypothetical protein CGRA01v4_11483 [Colletotrichum graminicola]|nr:hypothetical protein CGRA01v4_11483 [Colletotrichum graminicola]
MPRHAGRMRDCAESLTLSSSRPGPGSEVLASKQM